MDYPNNALGPVAPYGSLTMLCQFYVHVHAQCQYPCPFMTGDSAVTKTWTISMHIVARLRQQVIPVPKCGLHPRGVNRCPPVVGSKHVMTVRRFCLSRSGGPVLPILSCMSCPACLSYMSCLSVLFCVSCSGSPVPSCPLCLSCTVCPVLPFLFCLSHFSCSASPVLSVLFCLFYSAFPF